MRQLFSLGANSLGRVVLALLVIVPASALSVHVLLMNSAYLTGQHDTPRQPIPFSHKHHVTEVGIDCRYCHTRVETSPVAGVPPTEICMSCHAHLWTENAPMLTAVHRSWESGSPLHWRPVNRLPGYVYFDHSIHVAKGVGCTTCHGPVGQMPVIFQARPLTMDWCLSCHRNPAPFVRPPQFIYAADWPHGDAAAEQRLLNAYLIDTQHLTDCSTCHR